MQRGASLLELAVVTAVMGLFVGAVLVSVNMVKSATVRNFINTIEATNSKASTFQLRFMSLPGDIMPNQAQQNGFAARAGSVGRGNGNGLIEGCLGAVILGCETALFWRDLSDAKLYQPAFTTAADEPVNGTGDNFQLKAYLPETPFPRISSIFVRVFQNRNLYFIGSFTAFSTAGEPLSTPALNPIQAEAIDEKMDDTQPYSGHVRVMKNLNEYETDAVSDAPMKCADAGRYTSAGEYNDIPLCQLGIDAGF